MKRSDDYIVESSDVLIDEAERSGIDVIRCRLPQNGACSVMDAWGHCTIGIDDWACTEAVARARVAHEMGHCARGAFYNIYAADDVIGKHERRADEWAIMRLIPERDFRRAVRSGYTEAWMIAERFCVPIEYACKTMYFYAERARVREEKRKKRHRKFSCAVEK